MRACYIDVVRPKDSARLFGLNWSCSPTFILVATIYTGLIKSTHKDDINNQLHPDSFVITRTCQHPHINWIPTHAIYSLCMPLQDWYRLFRMISSPYIHQFVYVLFSIQIEPFDPVYLRSRSRQNCFSLRQMMIWLQTCLVNVLWMLHRTCVSACSTCVVPRTISRCIPLCLGLDSPRTRDWLIYVSRQDSGIHW